MNPRRTVASKLSVLAALAASVGLAGCSSPSPDEPKKATASDPYGTGERIEQVMNPSSSSHPASGATVTISGATFLIVDTFDETDDGKSIGTVYLQDTGSTAPYSGASLYQPTYLPASLRPTPGDVLDLTGQYQAETSLGSASFPTGEALIQISKPTVTFRFDETSPPVGTVIQLTDLNTYATAVQWENMLVTVNNITMGGGLLSSGGRTTANLSAPVNGVTPPTMSNELFDLAGWNSTQTKKVEVGAKLKSLTGIVTWFEAFHIAPRSPADIVFAE